MSHVSNSYSNRSWFHDKTKHIITKVINKILEDYALLIISNKVNAFNKRPLHSLSKQSLHFLLLFHFFHFLSLDLITPLTILNWAIIYVSALTN